MLGQSYTIAGRALSRANLRELKEWYEYLSDIYAGETSAAYPAFSVGTMRRD
jgi:hypothetical protein